MSAASKCVLAVDQGSSGPKVSVVDEGGGILATRSGAFETFYSENGAGVEQDGNQWWDVTLQLCKEVIDEMGEPSRVAAIGICAQYFSSIPVDSDGNPTHNAIMWEDTRASPYVKEKMGGFPEIFEYNIFKLLRWLYIVGIPPVLVGVDGGSHMLLFKNAMPEAWEKTYKVLEPADYMSMKFTGRFQTNENTAFAYSLIRKAAWGKGQFDQNLIKRLDLDPDKFPEVLEVGCDLGPPTMEIREYLGLNEDVKVFSGMQDSTAAIIGGGATELYDMVIEIGTTLNTGIVIDRRIMDAVNGIFSVSSPIKDQFLMVGEPGLGAKVLNLVMRNIFQLDDELTSVNTDTDLHHAAIANKMAAESPAGANGLVFMPWITGSSFPEQDMNIRAGFLNMTTQTTRSDMIRAIFEAYAMNFRWMTEISEKKLGRKIEKVNFTGGGALWDTAAQVCADVMQKPVHQIEDPRQANTRGIAFVCFNALGMMDLKEMKSKVKVQQVFEPNAANTGLYNERFDFFKHLYQRMRKLHGRLKS